VGRSLFGSASSDTFTNWTEAFYFDPLYGLSNLTNVRKWHAALNEDADLNKRLAFEAELRTYFGVTKYYITQYIVPKWQKLYSMPSGVPITTSTPYALLQHIIPANGSG